jgi:hypothetical protein
MTPESRPQISIERHAWRGTGVVLAIESIKILASMPRPSELSETNVLEYMGVGLLIPIWSLWGEARGWFRDDIGAATSSVKALFSPKE